MQAASLKGSRLSIQQARLWPFQKENRAYYSLCAVRVQGPLERSILQRAVHSLLARHEILRTVFRLLPSMDLPVQVVLEPYAYTLSLINAENAFLQSGFASVDEFVRVLQKNIDEPAPDQRFCAWLVYLAHDMHVLFIRLPALCADIPTLWSLIGELQQTYTAYLHEEEDVVNEPLQYADVSAWQDELLDEEEAEFQKQYWRKKDFSLLGTLSQVLGHENAGEQRRREVGWEQTFHPEAIQIEIKDGRQIRSLAEEYKVSPPAFLLTCWQVLLSRFTGAQAFLLGVGCDGRNYEELVGAPGLYTRFLPFEAYVRDDQPFKQLLSSVDFALQEDSKRQLYFTWASVPFADESTSVAQIFPVSFEYHAWPEFPTGALTLALHGSVSYTEPFLLRLSVTEIDVHMRVEIQYDAARVMTRNVHDFAAMFSTLLGSVVEQPSARIDALRMVAPVEQERLIQSFTAPRVVQSSQTLPQLFEIQVAQRPDSIAVVSGEEQLTYQSLNRRANQLARMLHLLGVGPNALVGLCVSRSLQMPVCLLAVLKAGGAYVPLDPDSPAARIEFQLCDVQPLLVLSERAYLPRLHFWDGQVLCLETIAAEVAREADGNVPSWNKVDDLAYVMYTSGSTGTPKGVQIRQQSVVNYVQALHHVLSYVPGLQFALVSTLAADLGNTVIFGAMTSGGCLHILPYVAVTSGSAFVRSMARRPADVLKIVPSHLSALLVSEPDAQILPLRYLILGGEALPGSLLKRLASIGGTCQVLNHYGPTEATIGVLVNVLGSLDAAVRQAGAREVVPLGSPLTNTEVYVLDRWLQLVPVGVTGELYLGGAGLASGYLQLPEQTAQRFVPHPFSTEPGARLYKTGDLGCYTAENQVEFLGRSDSQVKVRGYRIELGEIEAVLRKHTDVRDAVALLLEDKAGESHIAGYVVPQQTADLSNISLREFVRRYLPDYMVPATFVILDTLPLTTNGKVDRGRLSLLEQRQNRVQPMVVAPRNLVEEMLLDIWKEVLGVQSLSIYDNFFHVGGHSLLATRIIARVRAVLQLDISIQALFEASTIAGFAQLVEQMLRSEKDVVIPALTPVSRTQKLPLSFAQSRLWFLDQLDPDNISYSKRIVWKLSGILHVTALERSLAELLQRHEILRTTFPQTADGEPIQLIAPSLTSYFPLIDLSGIDQRMQEAEVLRLVDHEAQNPFDLAQGPLLRIYLFILNSQEHVLLLNTHHIISDAWSNNVLFHELASLYRAFLAGLPSPLTSLPLQYADFAVWQRQYLQGAILEAQLAYWKKQLVNIPVLELPTDYPRPLVRTFRGASISAPLPASLHEGLNSLSQQEGVTLFMTLLTAFQVLLMRYTGQYDMGIGTPIANRMQAELEGIVGFFVNTLVLRTDLSGKPSFIAALARVRETTVGAYVHQDVPFEQLVEALQPERNMSHPPFFQAMFGIQQENDSRHLFENLTTYPFTNEHTAAKFDITWSIVTSKQGIRCDVEYSTDVFAARTISTMLEHWQTLLQGIIAAPETCITDLPILTEYERNFLLVDWNAAQMDIPQQENFATLFEKQVVRAPEAIALVSEQTSLTYGELNRRANQLADYLGACGIKPEVLVGVYVEHSVVSVLSLLAILKAGAVYLPLDATYPPKRLSLMIEDACPALLLTEHVGQTVPSAWDVKTVCLEEHWSQIALQPEESPRCSVEREHVAYVIYTSGSTGAPKGVQVTHRGIGNLALAQSATFGVGEQSHVLQFASLSFDASISEIMMALLTGASLFLAYQEHLLPGPELLRLLDEWAITVVTLPPSALAVLPVRPLPALQSLIVAGEVCRGDLVSRWARDRRMYNAYGPTEATVCASIGACAVEEAPPPIGTPIANTQLYVLDSSLQVVPQGVPGELYIAGVGLARGYLNNAEATARAFVPNPFSDETGARLYKTGDRVRLRSDRLLEFLGRRDQQVKVRGYRIELSEIEVVLQQHPAVREAVALVREDMPGDQRIVVYLVGWEGEVPAAIGEIRDFLQESLPDYMLPSHVVTLAAFPLLPNGKIDRHALPSPEIHPYEANRAVSDARTPMEEALAAIWCDILGDESIGVYENFFDLGGHSLLATQLMARVQAISQVELPVRSLFEAPTIAGLAQRVEQALQGTQPMEAPPLVPVSRAQDLPLSFAQQRLWFLDQLEPGNAAYLIANAWLLQGDLHMVALQKSLEQLIERHESLRTLFPVKDGQPVQVIGAPGALHFPLVDLSTLPSDERDGQTRRLAAHAARQSLDLARGPLMRVFLVKVALQEYLLLFTIHHIISDGWSSGVFVRELTMLYGGQISGNPVTLPPLPLQYADYALWQRQWLQGEVLQQQLDYWKAQLSEAPVLALRTNHPRPALQTYHGARELLTVPASLRTALMTVCQREGVTLFMLLLASFQVLLARYSGQSDISVGTPIANRRRTELEGLIGFFVNTLVMRSDLSGNPTFVEVLRRVREVALGAYAHQDVPFEQLVELVEPRRDVSRSPLFSVLFSLQNIPPLQLAEVGETFRIRSLEGQNATAKFDLTLSVAEGPAGLQSTLVYNTDLFEGETIRRLLAHWQHLLEAIAQDERRRLSELSFLSEQEEAHLLALGCNVERLPACSNFLELFERQVDERPDAQALLFEEQRLTYAGLNSVGNRLGRVLRQKGVGPGNLVGVCVRRGARMLLSVLGILKAGAGYVPLDTESPARRLQQQVQDARVSLVLVEEGSREVLAEHAGQVLCLEEVSEGLLEGEAENLAVQRRGEDLAYVIYTSGSTGVPKGVMVQQQNLLNYLQALLKVLTPEQGWHFATVSTLAADLGNTMIFGALASGGCLHILDYETVTSAAAFARAMECDPVDVLKIVPSHLAALLSGDMGIPVLPSRWLLLGGEVLPVSLVQQLQATGVTCRIVNHYGPTETTVGVLVHEVGDWQGEESVPLGRPLANTQAYVLDRWQQLVPWGVVGEIYLGGAGVAVGYQGRAQETAERFVPHPWSQQGGARLYRTGDLGYWTQGGELVFVGRADGQVKRRGYRIELGEIEAVLRRQEGVRDSVVVAQEEAGELLLVGYVVGKPGERLRVEAVQAALREELPEVMQLQELKELAALPLTANGKVDRARLPQVRRARRSEGAGGGPRSGIEELVQQVWQELLPLSEEGERKTSSREEGIRCWRRGWWRGCRGWCRWRCRCAASLSIPR